MNDLIMDYHFASNVFRAKRPEFIAPTLEVFNEYSNHIKAQQGIFDVYPGTMTNTMIGDERLQNLSNTILEYAWHALNNQGYNMGYFNTFFISLWGQEHQRTSNMEYHLHGESSQISGFYFLEAPEHSTSVFFHDPRAVKVYSGLPERDMNQLTQATSMVNYTPEPGDLIMTNSWLPHSFSRNKSYLPVKFLHFNIGVMSNQQAEVSQPLSDKLPAPAIVV